jgi:hypothetical protein
MYWVEHRQSLQRSGPPKFVPVEFLESYTGFRGVYEYDLMNAQEIERQGHMRNLDDLTVYSSTLFLDFDSCPTQAEIFKQFLLEQNYSFEEYDSGNRSIHFHVDLVPMMGPYIPQVQKSWVKAHAPD